MMDKTDLMNAWADGALTAEEAAEAQAQAQSDPAAANEHAWAIYVKDRLSELPEAEVPDGLWKTCTARLDAIDRVRTAERTVGKYSWALCGVFVVAILSAAFVNRSNPSRALPSTSVASLVSGLSPVSTTRPAEALRTVRAGMPGAPLHEGSFELLNVAVGHVDGRRAAKVRMRDAEGPFELFLVAGAVGIEGFAPGRSGFAEGTINGESAIAWTEGGYLVLVTSDRSHAAVQSLVRQLRGE
jgi:anti-sigma factor RsiW